MIYLWFIVLMCMSPITSGQAQQFYDHSNCSTDQDTYQGSRYTCTQSQKNSCKTFLVFRSNQRFQTVSDISNLFHMISSEVIKVNYNLTSSQILKPGKEVLLPVTCNCSSDSFYQASLSYQLQDNHTTSFSEIACGVFEGLIKSATLQRVNLNITEPGSELNVPLRCACPENSTGSSKKVKHLVTYPIIEGDEASKLSQKFGISEEDFWGANSIDSFTTLFPDTTVLIPLNDDPPIKLLDIPESPSPPSSSGFIPTHAVTKTPTSSDPTSLYIAGSIIGLLLLFMAMLVSVLYIKTLKKWKSNETVQPFTPTTTSSIALSPIIGSSTATCLSPDLLAEIKFCLVNYSMEELRNATKDFSQDTQMSDDSVYKGVIVNNNSNNNHHLEIMIKRMRLEDTHRAIDLHSKINHINIVNLTGVCYGDTDLLTWSYLIFEWPKNGCLRDCLCDSSNPLPWSTRTRIAFDIARGLHYLRCCAFSSYVHSNLSSRNIFITAEYRGKLADIAAPENFENGSVYEKVDIFSFGVVLLELISARENNDGKLVRESIGFLGGGCNNNEGGGCFEGLRGFMDPNLKDYPLAEALCLAVLAKACVEDDPQHRPTMDDIMKVLVKMVWPHK